MIQIYLLFIETTTLDTFQRNTLRLFYYYNNKITTLIQLHK